MAIKHILKDGRTVPDIAGIVIRQSDAPKLYAVIGAINRKEERNDAGNGGAHPRGRVGVPGR